MRAKPFTSGFLGRLRPRGLALRLHRDQRGHVAIMYAVCMLFVSALVFFVIAAGKRYLQKETIQAAVDAASFAAAAAEAKTMNTIAFCNLVLAIGIAMVYTLEALFGAILTYIAAIVGLEASTLGLYCIGDAPDCAVVDSGLAEEIAGRYQVAATELGNRLRPVARAAQELTKAGPILMAVEADTMGMHEAYSKRLQGLIVVTDPLKPKLPVIDGPPSEICGPEPRKAENGLALGAIGLLELPEELPPEGKLIYITPAFAVEDPISAAAVCGGSYGIIPQTLEPLWERDAPVKVVGFLSDSKPDDRRAYLSAAASQWGEARQMDSKWMLATSEASVYGFDGTKGEDMWHMDWRARLVLSQAKDFGPLKALTSGPIGQILKSVWVH